MRFGRRTALIAAAVVAACVVATVLVWNQPKQHSRLPPSPPGLSAAALRLDGAAVPRPADFFGVNGASVRAQRDQWSNAEFLGRLKTLQPQNIRLFGGSTANFWDWQTGQFITGRFTPPEISKYATREGPLTLAELAAAVKAGGSEPVYVLNLLTSTLPHQLDLLRTARAMGLPVAHVELGNEFYFSTGEAKHYPDVFPTGADYGRLCTVWIAAIKREFPGVQIAAVATPHLSEQQGPKDTRRHQWNASMFTTLRGEDAVTMHSYANLRFQKGQLTPADVIQSVSDAYDAVDQALGAIPQHDSVWVTEWNYFDATSGYQSTWMQSLAVAAYASRLVSNPRITLTDYHSLIGSGATAAIMTGKNALALIDSAATAEQDRPAAVTKGRTPAPIPPTLPATQPFGLSAGGQALLAVLQTAAGGGVMQRVSLSGASGVMGFVSMQNSSHAARALLVNPSSASVRVDPSALGAPDWRSATQAASPATYVVSDSSVSRTAGAPAHFLELPPYSLTTIESAGG